MEIIKDSRIIHSYDVFLGGSCNPTTWRKDLAIPYFQEAGVSFYNPQVDHWSEDLIETEHAAKENAKILFFVIDGQTRNVVTAVETANFAGFHTNMMLVIRPQNANVGLEVAGEQISGKELEDLEEARKILHLIFCYQGILVFDNIHYALSKAVQIIKDGSHRNIHSICEERTVDREIRVAFDMFDANKCGRIDIFDARVAIRLIANQNLAIDEVLNQRIFEPDDSSGIVSAVSDGHEVYLTLDQFHAVASKHLQSVSISHNRRSKCNTELTYISTNGRSLCSPTERNGTTELPSLKDICLLGENGDDIQWREDIAVPMIEKSNLSYYSTASMNVSVLLNARTLLFVIPNKSRSLATMALAAYCISKRCNMVLCIQNLSKDNCNVHEEKLTKTAINDYNRGRTYLADLASREGVPTFQSITKAVEIAIQKS